MQKIKFGLVPANSIIKGIPCVLCHIDTDETLDKQVLYESDKIDIGYGFCSIKEWEDGAKQKTIFERISKFFKILFISFKTKKVDKTKSETKDIDEAVKQARAIVEDNTLTDDEKFEKVTKIRKEFGNPADFHRKLFNETISIERAKLEHAKYINNICKEGLLLATMVSETKLLTKKESEELIEVIITRMKKISEVTFQPNS